MKIGFIGLGFMGRPMAKNLLKAGYELVVFDLSEKAVKEVVDCGALRAASIEEIAKSCPTLITMLPNGPQVKSVMLGETGATRHMRPGSLLIDMSSISPVATEEIHGALAERGIRMLDAPVSGAEAKAIDGTLAIMVGGDPSDFQEALPILSVLGGNVTLVGPSGSGSACKLTNQIIIAASMAAVCEGFMLAKKSGCNIEKVFEAISTGFAGSPIMNSTLPRILARNFEPGFKIDLHAKDLVNAVDAAGRYDAPVPLARDMLNLMIDLQADGEGGSDNSAIAKYYEKIAGLRYTD